MPTEVALKRVGERLGGWTRAGLALTIALAWASVAHSDPTPDGTVPGVSTEAIEAGDTADASEATETSDASDATEVVETTEPYDPSSDPLYDPLYDDVYDEEFEIATDGYPDPLERSNRGVFAFNRQVDKWILDPLTRAYQYVVPKPARTAIARVFVNLSSTKTIVNDLLQLEWVDAGVTTSRLVINTTVGIAGLFDVAAKIGLDGHESDFGQTLALAGTPSGPYLVLPIFGPSTVRDGVGTVVDGFFQPTYYIIGPADLLIGPTEIFIYSSGSGITLRDQHYDELKALQDSSVDFYAALRSGYYQDRVAAIWGRREDHLTTKEPVLTIFDETEVTKVSEVTEIAGTQNGPERSSVSEAFETPDVSGGDEPLEASESPEDPID